MVGFGTKRQAGEENFPSSKENQHMQPSRVTRPGTDDPLHSAGKPNMRDYVDSMDTAFPAGSRSTTQIAGKQSGLSFTVWLVMSSCLLLEGVS